MPVAEYFKPYTDFIFEIGLTPNHMDAMSHMGVARDVCAWLSHQDKKDYRLKMPVIPAFAPDLKGLEIKVVLENQTGLRPLFRYNDDRYTHCRIAEMDAG